MNILTVGDLHYVNHAQHAIRNPARKGALGCLLLHRAFHEMVRLKRAPDLVVLLGDLVDSGTAPGVEEDLEEVAREAAKCGVPVLAVPGNHDGDQERFVRIFGTTPGLHELGDYGFLVFHDRVGEGDVTTRPAEQVAWAEAVAAEKPELPLVALQHNPIHPRIDDGAYPYMLTNTDAVIASYSRAGVILSLSGHYHAGQPASKLEKTLYCTVPSLAESPFHFAAVELCARRVRVRDLALKP